MKGAGGASSAVEVPVRTTDSAPPVELDRQRWWESQQLLGFASVVMVFVLWEIIGRWIVTNDAFFVPLTSVASDMWEWITSGEFTSAFATSAKEFGVGFAGAIVVGLVFGFWMGLSRTAWAVLNPIVSGLYSTPLLALTPLFIIWFGIGITSKALMIMFLATFSILINTAAGTRDVDQAHLDAVRAFGASPLQLTLKVRLPSALSFIIAGLRLAMARCLVGIFVVELFGSLDGIGFAISNAATVFNTDRMFAGIFVLAGMGVLFSWGLTKLEHVVAPWRLQRDRSR